MKSMVDHIGANWVKLLLSIAITLIVGFNTYMVNKVDNLYARDRELVFKEDYILEISKLNSQISKLNEKLDTILLNNIEVTIKKKIAFNNESIDNSNLGKISGE
jgi:hypothetical protein